VALIRGTLDVLVLKSLSWTAMHAFEIMRWLEERSDGSLAIEGPALIQALHRMEAKELVAGEWGVSENGRRACYYKLTAAGRSHLRAETERLANDTEALMRVLTTKRA
jgi:DNA-binding PadR family transcriptional regulator